jgi:hypothetical protein
VIGGRGRSPGPDDVDPAVAPGPAVVQAAGSCVAPATGPGSGAELVVVWCPGCVGPAAAVPSTGGAACTWSPVCVGPATVVLGTRGVACTFCVEELPAQVGAPALGALCDGDGTT